jgi:hypothetical protein
VQTKNVQPKDKLVEQIPQKLKNAQNWIFARKLDPCCLLAILQKKKKE